MNRSLSQDCRQWTTAVLRSVPIFMLLAAVAICNLNALPATGLFYAKYLLWLNYSGITLAAFSWFAAAITEERELKTLALLRMTGLNGAAILLGKWLPRLAVVQVLIIVQLPLAVLAVTMGGVTRHQLFATYVGIMAYTVMISSIALLWSAVCKTARRASWLVVACWFALTSGPPLVKTMLPGGVFHPPFEELLAKLSPWLFGKWRWLLDQGLYDFVEKVHLMSMFRKADWVLSLGNEEPLIDWQVVSSLTIAAGAFLIAWYFFERVTLYNLETPVKPPFRVTRAMRRRRKASGKRPKQVGRSWRLPFAWKEFYFVGGGWTWMGTKLLFYPGLALLVMGISSSAGQTSFQESWDQMGAQLLVTIGGLGCLAEMAGMSGRFFGAEIHSGTMRELMVLPTSVGRIGYEKFAGACLVLLPPFATLVVGLMIDERVIAPMLKFWLTTNGLVAVAAYLAFVHACILFSVHLRTGAAVLAFFLLWLCAVAVRGVALLMLKLANESALQIGLLIFCVAFCVFSQWRIGRDVVRKATR